MGVPHLNLQLLFGEYVMAGEISILPSVVATFMTVLVSLAVADTGRRGYRGFFERVHKKGQPACKNNQRRDRHFKRYSFDSLRAVRHGDVRCVVRRKNVRAGRKLYYSGYAFAGRGAVDRGEP